MFRDLAESFWREHLESNPLDATIMGYRDHDDRMPDVTPEGRAGRRARLASLAEDASAMEPASLDRRERLSLQVLRAEIDDRIAEIDIDLDAWTLDPLFGPQVLLLQVPELQPVETPEQAARLVERYRAFGPYLDGIAANLRRALAGGRVASAAAASRVSRQMEALLDRPLRGWELLAPARAPRDAWDGSEAERFGVELEEAVRAVVRPAFERFDATISGDVLPRARPDERVGLSFVPGGREAYGRLIRLHTSLDLDADAVHRQGREEIGRIREEMREVGERALGTDDLEQVLLRLRGDPALRFRDRDEIEAKARAALARAQEALPRVLGRLPRTGCDVRRLEAFEEEDSTIAYYRPPAIDGSRPGAYFVNTHAPETRPRYDAEALAYHESVPGHHVQIALAQEDDGLPEFRRHLGCTAFVEGWGLYAERLADELELYTDDLDRLGMLSFEAWRACRLVVDTGLHHREWSRRRAIDYLLANSALAENNVTNEVDRYIVWPGQALAYKIGQREILSLRGEAEARGGTAFDLRSFHDALLAGGALPLPLLRARLAEAAGSHL